MRWLDRTLLASPFPWCLCTTQKQFNRAMKKLGTTPEGYLLDGASATTHFVGSKRHGRAIIVSLGPTGGRTKAQVYSILVHEAVHVWQEILEGAREDKASSELEAYCVQALTQALFTEYERQVSQPARKGKHRRSKNGK